MGYRSVEWHTNSEGRIHEVAVEYNQTFWQWVFRKPATSRRWRSRDGKEWCLVISGFPEGHHGEVSRSLDEKDVKELLRAMDHVIVQQSVLDLEDRCRKILRKG